MSSEVKSHFSLWTKEECPFCCEAVEFLKSKNISYNTFVMDNNLETLERIKEKFEWPTVPIIVKQTINGDVVFVGGCSDLIDQYEETND